MSNYKEPDEFFPIKETIEYLESKLIEHARNGDLIETADFGQSRATLGAICSENGIDSNTAEAYVAPVIDDDGDAGFIVIDFDTNMEYTLFVETSPKK